MRVCQHLRAVGLGVRHTVDLVLVVVFDLRHVAYNVALSLASVSALIWLLLDLQVEVLDLSVLVPVIEEPVDARVLSLLIVSVF